MKSVEERLKGYQPLWENWRYTGEFLGKGGMSSVFEIEHNAYGSRDVCALKIIEVKTASDGRVRIPNDILNEIQIMRNLSDCPNIVRYYDDTTREVFDDTGALSGVDILIRMEKLRSINERTTLSEAEVIKLAKDMCNALIYVGKKKIIHRDIKPHNIFIDGSGRYKLGDFGISKIVSEYSVKYTMEIGTQAYVAPEMYKGDKGGKYDVTTDIYSLGLVLYAFLNNNKPPFEDTEANMGTAIHRRLNGDSFSEPANGRKKLKEIVMKACSFDSHNRYRDAEAMLKELESLDKPRHEKYIADPYITIPANEDESDEGIIYYDPVAAHSKDVAERRIETVVAKKPPREKRVGLKLSDSFGHGAEKTKASVEPTEVKETKVVSPHEIKTPSKGGLRMSKSFTDKKASETEETAVRPSSDSVTEEKSAGTMFKRNRKL